VFDLEVVFLLLLPCYLLGILVVLEHDDVAALYLFFGVYFGESACEEAGAAVCAGTTPLHASSTATTTVAKRTTRLIPCSPSP
jgi:hypothetical protein